MELAIVNILLRPESLRRQRPVGHAFILTVLKRTWIGFDCIDMDNENVDLAKLEEIPCQGHCDPLCMGCRAAGLRMLREITSLTHDQRPRRGTAFTAGIYPTILVKSEVKPQEGA